MSADVDKLLDGPQPPVAPTLRSLLRGVAWAAVNDRESLQDLFDAHDDTAAEILLESVEPKRLSLAEIQARR